MPSLFELPLKTIAGEPTTLEPYKGHVLLIVNTASKCGLTPQYEGLEKLYGTYKHCGFEVLGFPTNDFAGQEPGTNQEIQKFCETTFNISFPMFEKVVSTGAGKNAALRSTHRSPTRRQDRGPRLQGQAPRLRTHRKRSPRTHLELREISRQPQGPGRRPLRPRHPADRPRSHPGNRKRTAATGNRLSPGAPMIGAVLSRLSWGLSVHFLS